MDLEVKGENVVLALWGRPGGSGAGVRLVERLLANESIHNVALIVFSDLACRDDYIKPLLKHSKLKFVYMTHESNMIDNKRIFLWPLGLQ